MRALIIFALLLKFSYNLPSSSRKHDETMQVDNMNGQYLLSNSHPNGKWDSSYNKFDDIEYIDVYSPEISTKYGEVYWTMMDPVPLDKDVVDKFSGKIMAVIGYETDQVHFIYFQLPQVK